ncbi:MAG TPA: AAA family ATPase [Sphingomicrobium sp.]|nr:AAA family ATPase [Sphingomicrobium sp.]
MSFGPENSAAPNAPTSGATSANGASPSTAPRTEPGSGSATTAGGRDFIHPRHQEWIEARGIDPALIAKFGICTKHEGGANWLALPYVEQGRVINHKYRLASEKRHKMDEGAPLTLWNHDALVRAAETGRPLIITEGEWDALAAMTAGFDLCSSVPNGAPQQTTESPEESKRYEFLWRSRELLDRVKQFIIATDSDGPGRILAADLARMLGPERCMFIDYPSNEGIEPLKDLNEVLLQMGPAAVVEVIGSAKPYPVKGLYRLGDFPEPPPTTSIGCGIEGLDEHFRLTLGTFAVISGWAGHGKTSLLMRLLANLMKAGVNVALGSFETLPRPILERRLRACIYGCGEVGPKANMPGPADELLASRLSVIAHTARDEDTELDLEYIIELAKVAVLRDGVRLLVLDPWNEIEHKRGKDETETEYVSRAIRMLKRFAVNYECAVWLVAHPRKPHTDGNPKPPSLYDLAGSAHFANKADYGVIIHRDDMMSSVIEARVVKVRMGLPGKPGRVELKYDPSLSEYQPA